FDPHFFICNQFGILIYLVIGRLDYWPIYMVPKLGIKRNLRKLIAGPKIGEINDIPPKTGKIINIKIYIPNIPINRSNLCANLFGNSPTKIFSPSRGETGIKLKSAKVIFMDIK